MQAVVASLRQFVRSLAALILVLAAPMLHAAEDRVVTVVFFAEHPLSDEEWKSLFGHIEAERSYLSNDIQDGVSPGAMPHPELLRGDQLSPGLVVDRSISVYLHGDCSQVHADTFLSSSPHPDALGWVERANQQIAPFIHIDCQRISRLLRPSAKFLSTDRRDLPPAAIARVFLHEWLHIEKQSAHHSHTGVSKPTFTAEDLTAHAYEAGAHRKAQPQWPSPSSPIHGK